MTAHGLTWRPTPHNLFHFVRGSLDPLGAFYGRPSRGMLTDVTQDGRPVLFMHNPKTGGKSLRQVLGVKHLSHTPPSHRLSKSWWCGAFIVVAVRDPFERFLSGYFDHVLKPKLSNALTRMYGPAFKKCGPREYLEVLMANPKFGGPQLQWTDFPCAAKPRADLVLRFEEIGNWCQQLRAAGVGIGDRDLPHVNASARSQSDLSLVLGLSLSGLAELEAEVRDRFRDDALALGYPAGPVSAGLSTSAACSA